MIWLILVYLTMSIVIAVSAAANAGWSAGSVILESPVIPVAGLSLLLVRIQTVDPSAFEMPDTPADEAGVFYSREKSAIGTKQAFKTGP